MVSSAPGVQWSVMVRSADGTPSAEHGAHDVRATASVGKLILLIEVALQLDSQSLHPMLRLRRTPDLAVADSGLWQHLGSDELRVDDLAVLVASVSDNLATNVLLHHVGLDAVINRQRSLGLTETALHDFVRDSRGPTDPPHLSSGTAAELSELMIRLGDGTIVSREVSAQVLAWLATGTDLSMVPSAWGLDPLAHIEPDRGLALWNKTGTNSGVRADVGLVAHDGARFSYAVLANWPDGMDRRDHVLSAMRDLGRSLVT